MSTRYAEIAERYSWLAIRYQSTDPHLAGAYAEVVAELREAIEDERVDAQLLRQSCWSVTAADCYGEANKLDVLWQFEVK